MNEPLVLSSLSQLRHSPVARSITSITTPLFIAVNGESNNYSGLETGASTGIPGDANCVSKITGGTKFDAQGGTNLVV